AVGIGAVVAVTGQPALPVRRQQPQRVPALAPPGIRDLAALEDDVIDRALGEAPAGRQSRMAGADDDRRDLFSSAHDERVLSMALAIFAAFCADGPGVIPLRPSRSSDW